MIDGAIAAVALPTISQDLGIDSSAAVLVVTVYQLVLVMTLLPFSRLGDRIGHRRLYQGGQIVFTAGAVLCLFVQSLPLLLLIRAMQALGAAAALSVFSALIRAIYPSARLGRGLGINSVIVSGSAALAPTIGGLLLSIANWSWLFAASAPLALVSLLLGRALPAPAPRDEHYDWRSALLCVATFGLTIGGLQAALYGAPPVAAALSMVAGAAAALTFIRRERTNKRPMLPVDLLARRLFAFSSLGALAAYIAWMLMFVSVPFRLQHQNGFSPSEVGAAIAAWPVAMIIVAPIAGRLSDRHSAALLSGIGMALASAAFVAFAYMPDTAGVVGAALRLGICGVGFALFISPNARMIISSAPAERAASAGGLVFTTRLVGYTLGATVAAALLSTGLGVGPAVPLVAAALTVAAGALFVLLRRTPQSFDV